MKPVISQPPPWSPRAQAGAQSSKSKRQSVGLSIRLSPLESLPLRRQGRNQSPNHHQCCVPLPFASQQAGKIQPPSSSSPSSRGPRQLSLSASHLQKNLYQTTEKQSNRWTIRQSISKQHQLCVARLAIAGNANPQPSHPVVERGPVLKKRKQSVGLSIRYSRIKQMLTISSR